MREQVCAIQVQTPCVGKSEFIGRTPSCPSTSTTNTFSVFLFYTIIMSHDNEELIDYEDEHDVVTNGAGASASSGAVATTGAAAAAPGERTNFSGIHSTGFRLVF